MPIQNLNFIPESVTQQRKVKQSKAFGTRFAIIFVVVLVLVSAGAWYYNSTTSNKISNIQNEITQKQLEITDMRKIGEDGYKLGIRLTNAKTIIDTRQEISTLMRQIRQNTPKEIMIKTWNYVPGQELQIDAVSMGGYVSIDDFRFELLKSVGKDQKLIFNDVILQNANFEKEDGTVNFEMGAVVNSEALYGTTN